MIFNRITLPFKLNDLEPYMSSEQIDYHYNKHHLAYQNATNKLIENIELPKHIANLTELMTNFQDLPSDIRVSVQNMGGGLINHNLFFSILGKDKKLINKELITAINNKFKSINDLQSELIKSAMNVFGSGWTWLVINKNKELSIINTMNQDNPWHLHMTPILGIDVWEHAYYIDYRNNRKEYLEKIFNILNWEKIAELYHEALIK